MTRNALPGACGAAGAAGAENSVKSYGLPPNRTAGFG